MKILLIMQKKGEIVITLHEMKHISSKKWNVNYKYKNKVNKEN